MFGSEPGGRRKRTAFRATVASLVIAGALVFSGCWARSFGHPDGHQYLVIRADVSDRIIFHATQCAPSGYHRGACALETIRNLCYEVPLDPPISRARCLSITWEDHRNDIEQAITEVIGPNRDCLAASIAHPGLNPPYDWFSLPLDAYGCVR
jgi:hypothetical protein